MRSDEKPPVGPVCNRPHEGLRGAYLFAGVTAGVTLGCGVLVQPSARRFGRRSPLTVAGVGLLLVAAGMALSAVVAVIQSPALVLLTACVLGSGYGLCLVFGLTEVARIADRGELAGLAAVFYALTYVGFAAPYVIALLTLVTRREYVLLGAATLALLTLVAVVSGARRVPGAIVKSCGSGLVRRLARRGVRGALR